MKRNDSEILIEIVSVCFDYFRHCLMCFMLTLFYFYPDVDNLIWREEFRRLWPVLSRREKDESRFINEFQITSATCAWGPFVRPHLNSGMERNSTIDVWSSSSSPANIFIWSRCAPKHAILRTNWNLPVSRKWSSWLNLDVGCARRCTTRDGFICMWI